MKGENALEQTLIIAKPDAVQRGLTGEIIRRFEVKGFRLVGMKFMQIDRALAAKHYAEHEGKSFYESLLAYITSAPSVVMVFEGAEGAIAAARNIIGATNPSEATPGSIRGDFGLDKGRNLVHGSANLEDARREVALFFDESELVNWTRVADPWIFED